MYSRDPVIAANIKAFKEQEQLERFLIYQRGQNAGMGRPVRAKYSRAKGLGLLFVGGVAAIGLLAWGAVLDKAHGAEREFYCYRVDVVDRQTVRCGFRPVELESLRGHYTRSETLRQVLSEGGVRCSVKDSSRYGKAVGRCSTAAGGDVGTRVRSGGYVSPYRRGN